MSPVLATVYKDKISLSPMLLDKANSNVIVAHSQSGNLHIASSFEKRTKKCMSIPYLQFLKERYKCQKYEITDKFCKIDRQGIIREYQLEEGTVVINLYN